MTHAQESATQALREAWFWSGVFRDHAAFIHDNLAPGQEDLIRWADTFRNTFAALHDDVERLTRAAGIAGPAGSYALVGPQSERPLAGLQGQELLRYEKSAGTVNQALLEALAALRGFKEQILQEQLNCTVKIHLPPTLIHHMINEAEEAYRVLGPVRRGEMPPAAQALHHHLLWLPDAAGHAGVLHAGTDPTQAELLKTTEHFKKVFDGMHIRALELAGMLRVAPRMVAALRKLNRDAMGQISTFRAFLAELREHLEGCEILGTLVPLLADHMLREELYYTEKVTSIEGAIQR